MLQMQDLMAKSMRDFKEGSIVKGRILEIRPREVLVDIGYKSEGVIPTAEFDDIESLEVGDEVEVCSSVSKTMKAWSFFPRKKRPIVRIGTKLRRSLRVTD
jgi:ribosomal protein S1